MEWVEISGKTRSHKFVSSFIHSDIPQQAYLQISFHMQVRKWLEDCVLPVIVSVIAFDKSDNLLPSQSSNYYPNIF